MLTSVRNARHVRFLSLLSTEKHHKDALQRAGGKLIISETRYVVMRYVVRHDIGPGLGVLREGSNCTACTRVGAGVKPAGQTVGGSSQVCVWGGGGGVCLQGTSALGHRGGLAVRQ